MTQPAQKSFFSEEVAVYETNKQTLLKDHAGKFVLIHKNELVDVFDTEANALQEGYKRFGPVPLYIRNISPDEQIQSAPALTLGILTMP